MMECYFDGSYHIGKNKAGIGWVVYQNGVEVESYSECFDGGKMSTNWAEYRALRSLLEYLKDKEGDKLIHGDSNLVIQQMSGRWSVGGGAYIPEYHKCCELNVEAKYKWIPRKLNGRADELSKYR
jgi:ribonuclease HI